MGALLMDGLTGLLKHPTVGDVRGLGLMAGIEMVRDKATKTRFRPEDKIARRLMQNLADEGVLTRAGDIIQLAPPLVITKPEVEKLVDAMDRSITRFEKDMGLA